MCDILVFSTFHASSLVRVHIQCHTMAYMPWHMTSMIYQTFQVYVCMYICMYVCIYIYIYIIYIIKLIKRPKFARVSRCAGNTYRDSLLVTAWQCMCLPRNSFPSFELWTGMRNTSKYADPRIECTLQCVQCKDIVQNTSNFHVFSRIFVYLAAYRDVFRTPDFERTMTLHSCCTRFAATIRHSNWFNIQLHARI